MRKKDSNKIHYVGSLWERFTECGVDRETWRALVVVAPSKVTCWRCVVDMARADVISEAEFLERKVRRAEDKLRRLKIAAGSA